MFLNETKPPLEHFGVLGMHWGVRKNRSSEEVKKSKVDRAAERVLQILDIIGQLRMSDVL